MKCAQAWLSRSSVVALVLAATLVCACLVGNSAQVSIRKNLQAARTQPIDVLVTGGADPTVRLDGFGYLPPDAWMTAGEISAEQVRALEGLDGVAVAAPVSVLPFAGSSQSRGVSSYTDIAGNEDAAWSSDVRVWAQDGTGRWPITSMSLAMSRVGQDVFASKEY